MITLPKLMIGFAEQIGVEYEYNMKYGYFSYCDWTIAYVDSNGAWIATSNLDPPCRIEAADPEFFEKFTTMLKDVINKANDSKVLRQLSTEITDCWIANHN
jgi:hypothetical protein